MAKLGNLFISLFADTAQFSSGLGKARSDLNSWSAAANAGLAKVDKAFTGLGHSIKDLGGEIFSVKGAFTALIGTIGVGSLLEMSKQAVEAVGSLGEVADQLGVTTDTLQAFRYAGTQVGVSSEEMDNALGKLTKTIGAAATGNKTAIDSFNQFGIKILDAQGKVRPTDDVIRDIADAINKLPDPAQRAAAAVDFFGKAGQRIIPFLQGGAKGVDEFVQKAKDLGLVFDAETIKRADDAADKLATLSLVIKTDFQAALVQLAPVLSAIANKMVTLSGAVNQFFESIKPDDQKSLPALEDKFSSLSDQLDALVAQRDELVKEKGNASGITKFLDSVLPGDSIDEKIAAANKKIADLQATLEKLHLLIDQRQLAASDPTVPASGKGASNPLPTVTGKTDAEKNIDKLKDKLRSLQDQLATLNQSADAGTTLSKALAGLDPDAKGAEALAVQISAVADAIDQATLANEAYAAAQQADAEAVKQFDAEMQKGKETFESLRTPIEVYRDRVAELQQLHMDGAIGSATYARGLDDAKKSLESTEQQASGLSSAMTELGSSWTSAFEDAALSMDDAGFSAKSVSDTLKGLLQDIERIILRLSVEDPATNFLTKLLSGGSISGLNSAGFRVTGAGPGASGNTSVGGGFFSWLTSLFHTGGIVGQSGVASRAVPAMAFAGAPRLHTGGFIGPGEVPAILKSGEGVFTPAQMAAMGPGGGSTIVSNVTINASGGTKDQNADLAAQASKAVKDALRQATRDTIRDETRKGNLLNPPVSV